MCWPERTWPPIPSPTRVWPVGAAVAIEQLNRLPGRPGYVTATFCERARYFRPENGARIDAVRAAIERDHAGSDLWPLLLTSLLEAADRVDSTTGLQMAYLKEWAPRAFGPLVLRVPDLVPGPGRALRGDACRLAGSAAVGPVDVAYLDPPYNQHRYDANYHVWETLVAGDAPVAYGVAAKREDLRDPSGRSPFNSRRTMPGALRDVVSAVDAEVVVLSYNNESWLDFDTLRDMCAGSRRRLCAGLRLVALRGGEDRHPQPGGGASRSGVPCPQHGVSGVGRPGTSDPIDGRCRGPGRTRAADRPGRPPDSGLKAHQRV